MSNDDLIRIAKIVGVHGLRGRLKIIVISDIIERFNPGNGVLVHNGVSVKEYSIEGFQAHKGKIGLLLLEGVDSLEKAQVFKGAGIYIRRADAEMTRDLLEEGSFYYYDIIGCDVVMEGRPFGRVVDLMEAGAGSVLVIETNEGRQVLIPFVDEMVDTTGIGEHILTVHPVDGLLDSDEEKG